MPAASSTVLICLGDALNRLKPPELDVLVTPRICPMIRMTAGTSTPVPAEKNIAML